MTNKEEQLIDSIKWMLEGDELAGRATEDSCTDGYDTHYVLLAQKIIAKVREADKE